ncbi:MAG: hypothetical protein PHV97_03820 [Candidatus Omnitrophica bacterium]|nr:hypothetical protein [Candidatus Omnitrophota bacterium]
MSKTLSLRRSPATGGTTAAITLLKRDCFGLFAMTSCFMLSIFLTGCSAPSNVNIPLIPKDHPAQKFYQAAQTGMLSDRVCRDNQGDPTIPVGKIEEGEGYTKTSDLTAGVFRFRGDTTGKEYLGVSFLQYNGFLQIPKVCAWEEKGKG